MSQYVTTGNEFCEPIAITADETFHMDEDRFRAFYERTSRPLWAYVSRLTGNRTAADDLVQESYYRLLRVKLPDVSETHLKSYLYRIATNLVRDEWRKHKGQPFVQADVMDLPSKARQGDDAEHRSLLGRALGRLKPREREMLWLASCEGTR